MVNKHFLSITLFVVCMYVCINTNGKVLILGKKNVCHIYTYVYKYIFKKYVYVCNACIS